ncbi:hypothetical protein ACVW0P_002618 [Mucilaginibacter sp. UYNi724]
MKRKLITSILLLAFIVACKKEQLTQPFEELNEPIDNSMLTVNDAKAWMATKMRSNTSETTDTSRKFKLGNITIAWETSTNIQSASGNYIYTDLPGSATFQNKRQGYSKLDCELNII